MKHVYLYLALLSLLIFACMPEEKEGAAEEPAVLLQVAERARWEREIPLFKAYWQEVHQALGSSFPVVRLQPSELEGRDAQMAQQLALQYPDFVRDLFDPQSGQPLHSEVMKVAPLSEERLKRDGIACKAGACYVVEMYNFFFNQTTTALVDVSRRQVLNISVKSGAREPNKRLQNMAREIALHTPELAEVLGLEPEVFRTLNSAVKPASCERSRHLGMAPVFEHQGRLLWVLVDGTDWKVVGYKILRGRLSDWQGKVAPVSERIIQNEAVMRQFCEQTNSLQVGDWAMEYVLLPSDGLVLQQLRFRGKPVLQSAKLVDWHVSYTFKEGFGYSDAVGCPQFSSAAVVAFSGPSVEPLVKEGDTLGFALVQDFRSPVWPLNCNYRYENRYEFYRDGRFRISGVNHGLGCGVTGWYRPVFRIDLGDGKSAEEMERWEGTGWKQLEKEAWHLQAEQTAYSPEGYLYKWYIGNGRGYYLEPARGQFEDGGRGDFAYTYVTVYKPEEGEDDMTTIGPCCNTNEEQGPEKFLRPAEPLAGGNIVLWYVPQMKNDNTPGREYCWAAIKVEEGRQKSVTWPGTVGPMFVPFEE